MKTIKLSMRDFKDCDGVSRDNHVICNRWGICFNRIFSTLRDANNYYDEKELRLPKYFICRVDWYN